MITPLQLYIAICVPTIVMLVGIIWNNVGLQSTRTEMQSLRTEMRADLAAVRSEMAGLRSEMKSELGDIRSLLNHVVDRHIGHEGRIATVEERTKPK